MAAVDMSKLHVLVVEDEIFVRNVIKRVLREKETGQISSATNGYEALTALEKAERKVDVILLDLEMPRMNGFEFIKRLHSDLMPPLSDTPVVVISGHSDKESLDKANKLGVGLFLLKPITPEQLVTRINAALRHRYN